jgi:hypothetical protein
LTGQSPLTEEASASDIWSSAKGKKWIGSRTNWTEKDTEPKTPIQRIMANKFVGCKRTSSRNGKRRTEETREEFQNPCKKVDPQRTPDDWNVVVEKARTVKDYQQAVEIRAYFQKE